MCYFCGEKFTGDKVYRSTECSKCGKELRSCVNCRFYSPGAHWDCCETITDCVSDKEVANFCDLFSYTDKTGNNSDNQKASQAKKAFLNLFGDN